MQLCYHKILYILQGIWWKLHFLVICLVSKGVKMWCRKRWISGSHLVSIQMWSEHPVFCLFIKRWQWRQHRLHNVHVDVADFTKQNCCSPGHVQCFCIQEQKRCLIWMLALICRSQPAQVNLEESLCVFFFSLVSLWQFTRDKIRFKQPTLTFQVGVFAYALQSGAVWQVFVTLPARFIVVLNNVWLAASWRSCPHIYFLSDALPNNSVIPCGPTTQTAQTPASLTSGPLPQPLGQWKPHSFQITIFSFSLCSVLCFNTGFPPQCCTYFVHTRCSLLTRMSGKG